MASTYVNDLRLNEMATGDQSGSWGTVTNTNLELIAEAFSYGTEAITTNADTHTTTIADGATDPGRSMFLKYTGTLDSTCTITIGPNTVSKLWFIENATSGSQDIIIKQGSGATVTIASGKTKVIYSDGVGSAAKMVDAFAALDVGSVSVDNITIDGNEIDVSSGDLTLDVAGDIILDAGGQQIVLKDDGTTFAEIYQASNNLYIESKGSDKDIFFRGNDGGSDITALTLDMSDAGTASFNHDVKLGDVSQLQMGASSDFQIFHNGTNNYIKNATSDQDLIIQGNDGGSIIDALTLDMSQAGEATFNGGVRIPDFITHVGDDNTFFGFPAGDQFRLETAGLERMSVNGSGTTFNEDGEDLDFRVESDGNENMLFVDAGNNRIGVGTSSPQCQFHSYTGSGSNALRVSGAGNVNSKTEIGYDDSAGPYIKGGSSGITTLKFYVDNTSLALTLASNNVATFTSDVNATNFNSTSDATLKTNVETLTGSLDAVKSLRGVSFDWLENGGSEIGVIAQEVEDVLPDVVNTNEDGIKSVKYGNIVAVLIEAMKEQQAQIDELKQKLNG